MRKPFFSTMIRAFMFFLILRDLTMGSGSAKPKSESHGKKVTLNVCFDVALVCPMNCRVWLGI